MAVVIREGYVLIQKRFRRTQGMVFEFPGGRVDSDETPKEAGIRELWEETGLQNLQWVATHQRLNGLGSYTHYVILLASENAQPQSINPARQQTFYWFKPSEIPRRDFYKADLEFMEHDLEQYV